ncbi:hypothetical protein F5H01DRAFT_167008 [Linnemannia elongata]|nr:hypothetical protein F5H01DRAFT_167008 [Linnemannia elongata]
MSDLPPFPFSFLPPLSTYLLISIYNLYCCCCLRAIRYSLSFISIVAVTITLLHLSSLVAGYFSSLIAHLFFSCLQSLH